MHTKDFAAADNAEDFMVRDSEGDNSSLNRLPLVNLNYQNGLSGGTSRQDQASCSFGTGEDLQRDTWTTDSNNEWVLVDG